MAAHDSERARAFPSAWRVGEHLTACFASATRGDVVVGLDNAAAKAQAMATGQKKVGLALGGRKEKDEEGVKAGVPILTVNLLVEALAQTRDFESAMAKKFSTSVRTAINLVVG